MAKTPPARAGKYLAIVCVGAGGTLWHCGQALAQGTAADVPDTPGYVAARPVATPEAAQTLQFTGTQNFTYDTNPLLIISGAKPLTGSTTQPELFFNDTTPTSKIIADTKIDQNVFDQSAFNSTDAHENLDIADQSDQWGTELKANADYDTVRSSEVTTFGLNVPRVRQTGYDVAPDVSYNFSEIDKLTFAGSAAGSHYSSNVFVNYNLYTVNPSYEHNFDPLNAGIFIIEGQRYQTESGPPRTTDTIGPSIGWLSTLTPRLTLKVTGGYQETAQTGVNSRYESSGSNYVFSGDLAFTGEQDKADLSLSRQQAPFANGTEALATSLSANESHNLNARFAVNASVTYIEAQYPNLTGINLSSEVTGGGGLTFHALQVLDVTAAYQYKNEKLTDIAGTISDNSFVISLVYRPVGATF
jgi:hypothetical protein